MDSECGEYLRKHDKETASATLMAFLSFDVFLMVSMPALATIVFDDGFIALKFSTLKCFLKSFFRLRFFVFFVALSQCIFRVHISLHQAAWEGKSLFFSFF